MDPELSRWDRRLVAKIQAMNPSEFPAKRAIGMVFLALSFIALILLLYKWLTSVPGASALRLDEFMLLFVAAFTLGFGAIQVARLQRIIHSLTTDSPTDEPKGRFVDE